MGERAVLSVTERECMPTDTNYPVPIQYNTGNYFALLWDEPISRRYAVDILQQKTLQDRK
jgi:hypothetical protein